jgi:hypothetical protein
MENKGGRRTTEFVFATDPVVIVAKGSSTLVMFDDSHSAL